MRHKLDLDKGVAFEFSDEEEWKGAKFISFKKVSTWKSKEGGEQKKFQNLTIKPEHWDKFAEWVGECIKGGGVPF